MTYEQLGAAMLVVAIVGFICASVAGDGPKGWL